MPINKVDIKLKQSQRLDDTDYGGGQATSIDVISGQINNLYPDISRLDRTYGRVSLRKAFLQVDTDDRSTYYGAHAVITKNASDPNVSVCFFTDDDWFSQRYAAKTRIENYLVQGPLYIAALWGNHYKGTKVIQLHTSVVIEAPKNGDVLVLVSNPDTTAEKKQYVRIQKVEESIRSFASSDNSAYNKKILMLTLGTALTFDFVGEDMFNGITGYNSRLKTCIYTTSVADASRYYGISKLVEDTHVNDTQIRVDSIYTRLLPSTQSSTAITDASINNATTTLIEMRDEKSRVVKNVSHRIEPNGKFHIGEAVKRSSIDWISSAVRIKDTLGDGNLFATIGGVETVIGNIDYTTGIITFLSTITSRQMNGELRYTPAVEASQASISGGIPIEVGNRGYTYTYLCDPIPMRGSLRVDYLAGGKWYTLKDNGTGVLGGADAAVGTGNVNLMTGSVNLTLGAQPDIGSMILLFWARETRFYRLDDQISRLQYNFKLQHEAIARNTLKISWNLSYSNYMETIIDDGKGGLFKANVINSNDDTYALTNVKVGTIAYATGEVNFMPDPDRQTLPLAQENFWIRYHYGEPKKKTFAMPSRLQDGRLTLTLDEKPILPHTVRVEWHTDMEEYEVKEQTIVITGSIDPTHIFYDDGKGGFEGENVNDIDESLMPGDKLSVIDYEKGTINFMPDRQVVFPKPQYAWKTMEQSATTMRQAWTFHTLEYYRAASIFPTDGSVFVDYRTEGGTRQHSYYLDVPKTYYIHPASKLELIPGSVKFSADGLHFDTSSGDLVDKTHYIIDNGTGTLYHSINHDTGIGTVCGNINYEERAITITDDAFFPKQLYIKEAVGTLNIDPVSYIVFRTPAAPLLPGVLQIRATMGDGSSLVGTAGTDGKITGPGVNGEVDFITGICKVTFGDWINDEWRTLAPDQQPFWYAGSPIQGNQVWRPYSVKASTILINCVATYFLSLDSKLLGLDPVRLPIDGKVPIFRDGYIVLIHSSSDSKLMKKTGPDTYGGYLDDAPQAGATYYANGGINLNDLALYDATGKYYPEIPAGQYCEFTKESVSSNYIKNNGIFYRINRTPVEYKKLNAEQIDRLAINISAWMDANQTNIYKLKDGKENLTIYAETDFDIMTIEEVRAWINAYNAEIENKTKKLNYSVNLAEGTVTFGASPDFNDYTVAPVDGVYQQYKMPLKAKSRIEDMCLATDTQITGHIGLSRPLTHDYLARETMVSSVLPSGDLQAAAYNEFIQNSWDNVWSDDLRGYSPLAAYDFVNFPIQVVNKGGIKERWLIRFTSSDRFDIVGENLGVLASGLPVRPIQDGGLVSAGQAQVNNDTGKILTSGWIQEGDHAILHAVNKLTLNDYWTMDSRGFSLGWQAGNCIRFNTDGANVPYWFVRTTLQAPPTEATDDYQFLIRGDSM